MTVPAQEHSFRGLSPFLLAGPSFYVRLYVLAALSAEGCLIREDKRLTEWRRLIGMESWERVNKQLPFSLRLFPPRPSNPGIKGAAEKKWNSNLAAAGRLKERKKEDENEEEAWIED